MRIVFDIKLRLYSSSALPYTRVAHARQRVLGRAFARTMGTLGAMRGARGAFARGVGAQRHMHFLIFNGVAIRSTKIHIEQNGFVLGVAISS